MLLLLVIFCSMLVTVFLWLLGVEADDLGLFILEKSYSEVAIATRMKSAKYSIAHQRLMLKGINQGVEH